MAIAVSLRLSRSLLRARFSVINENTLEIGTATNTRTHSPVTVTSPTYNVRAIDCRQLMTKSPDDCPVKQHHEPGIAFHLYMIKGRHRLAFRLGSSFRAGVAADDPRRLNHGAGLGAQ